MSKAHDPHWRYIAFRVTGPSLGRGSMTQAIKRHFARAGWPQDHLPQLTRYEFPLGIVKVYHHRLDEARRLLPALTEARDGATPATLAIETLSSSGTIKALTQRIGALQVRDPKGTGKTPGKEAAKTPAKSPAARRPPTGGPKAAAPPPGRRPRLLDGASGPAAPPGRRRQR